MAGPRDLIHRAASRRTSETEDAYAERIPAPIQMSRPLQPPVQPERRNIVQTPPAPGISQAANWRTPPLMPGTFPVQEGRAAHEHREPAEHSEDSYRIVPRDIGGHAIYRDLMRSHDRMGTRHIQPRG